MSYRRKIPVYEAVQWTKGYRGITDGVVFPYVRSNPIAGEVCETCSNLIVDHGWLKPEGYDGPDEPGFGSTRVCPNDYVVIDEKGSASAYSPTKFAELFEEDI